MRQEYSVKFGAFLVIERTGHQLKLFDAVAIFKLSYTTYTMFFFFLISYLHVSVDISILVRAIPVMYVDTMAYTQLIQAAHHCLLRWSI